MANESVPLTHEQKDHLHELLANSIALADLLNSAGESDANIPGRTLGQVAYMLRNQMMEAAKLAEKI